VDAVRFVPMSFEFAVRQGLATFAFVDVEVPRFSKRNVEAASLKNPCERSFHDGMP
jgi:hypothetical protein